MTYPKLTDKPGALETAAAIRSGKLSPMEAVDAAITRIEQLDAHVNALAVPNFEAAYAAAKAMDGKTPRDDQPLFGVPMTIKESFDIAGLPSTFGLAEYRDNIADSDSRVVSLLKAAGAIIVGKTNVPPNLADWQSNNPIFGRTNNPHDHGRSPGGSSGGSAAAVASGMVACEVGTDIGGSIRVPAHFCGIWGHKPSWGLVSKRGHQHPANPNPIAHDGVLSVAGPLARNADDLDALLRIIADRPIPEAAKPLRECRLLLVTDYPGSPIDDHVRGPIEAAVAELEKAGVTVDRSSDLLPDLADQNQTYFRMLNTAMARGAPSPDGKQATATDWFDFLDAQAANEAAWAKLFETYDFVLAPPAPVLAIPHIDQQLFTATLRINGKDLPASPGLAWAGIATFPNLPSTVVPIGASDVDGSTLPCGMQVMGPRWGDFGCICAARQIDAIVNG